MTGEEYDPATVAALLRERVDYALGELERRPQLNTDGMQRQLALDIVAASTIELISERCAELARQVDDAARLNELLRATRKELLDGLGRPQ